MIDDMKPGDHISGETTIDNKVLCQLINGLAAGVFAGTSFMQKIPALRMAGMFREGEQEMLAVAMSAIEKAAEAALPYQQKLMDIFKESAGELNAEMLTEHTVGLMEKALGNKLGDDEDRKKNNPFNRN